MATYDEPFVETYFQPSAAFGATTDTQTIIGPRGKRGLVRDIQVLPTADFVGTTTVPEINVGVSSGDTTYARFRLGTTAILGYTSAAGPRRATQVVANRNAGLKSVLEDFTGHVMMETDFIPADTAVVITRKLGTGGTPAGTAASFVTIEWF